ncbi:hypothetical protein Ahy_A02g006282 isoform B [Arachis hypogaea]|uniref:GRF-type domain-containing protein n=2 Tax=Arachis TaxID=3817 RepID=A0A445E9S9_ARAHY|nr:hypothetical protein Ahy_A02g006282 isoform B [Arachis hypogaea]
MAAQSSTSSRSRASSHGRLLLCSYGEKPVLRISGTKENPGCRFWGCVYFEVQQGCNFFRWADPETEVEHSEVARIRKKLSMMKSRTKAAEWKLKVVAVLGFFGWVGFLCLLLQSWSKATQQCVIPLNLV